MALLIENSLQLFPSVRVCVCVCVCVSVCVCVCVHTNVDMYVYIVNKVHVYILYMRFLLFVLARHDWESAQCPPRGMLGE